MSGNIPTVVTALASGVRTATNIWDPIIEGKLGGNLAALGPANESLDFLGMLAYLEITNAPGADTVLLALQERNPVSGTWSDVSGAVTLAQVATGLVRLVIGPSLATVAASAAGATLQQPLPARWRLRIVHSGAGNFTYSLSLNLWQRM